MSTTDTVKVVLSAAGIAYAKGQQVGVHGGLVSVTFQDDVAVEVPVSVWTQMLQKQQIGDQPMFTLAPDVAVVDTTIATPSVPASTAKKTKSDPAAAPADTASA